MRTDGVHCRQSVGHRASKPQSSSKRILPLQVTMDQFVCASLSHTHYWYEVGMLKVPSNLPLWLCLTEETNAGTTLILYAAYRDFWKMKVLETKSRQTLMFDPGGSTDRQRACPFLGAWRALLCGEVFVWAPDGT